MLSGTHFYNQTIRKAVSVFGTIFNNISIKRHNSVSERVPIAYGPRQKFLDRIQQGSRTDETVAIKVPRMAFNITDIAYDSTIKLNKLNKKFTGEEDTSKSFIHQSVPYILSMELNILSKTQDEALQILEQILPTFSPEFTVAIVDMEGEGHSVDVPITLSDVSIQDDYEGDFESRRTIIYTLNFTMKIRFVGSTKSGSVIYRVDSKIHDDSRDDKTIESTPIESVRTEASGSPIEITDTFGFDNSP
jgi:hypothetical protein